MTPGDVIHIKYPVLFSVRVLHHYFLDKRASLFDNFESEKSGLLALAEHDIRQVFEIKPTPSTTKLMAAKGFLFKLHQFGFTIIAQGDQALPSEVERRLSDTERLVFSLKIIDPYFLQYSAAFSQLEQVRVEKAGQPSEQDRFFKRFYRFDNRAATLMPFLAKGPSNYDNARAYSAEEMVRSVSGGTVAFHQAKQTLAAGVALGSASWNPLPTLDYAAYDANLAYEFGQRVRAAGNLGHFEAKQLVPPNTPPQTPDNAFWRKLNDLNLYYASAADLGTELELKDDYPADAFALVSIAGGHQPDEFSLYNATFHLRSPKFELRFQNRWSWWHYLNVPSGSPAIPDDFFPITLRGKATGRDNVTNPDGKSGLRREPPESTQPLTRLYSDIYL
ncbi:MAG: hypothetical protein IPM82_25870 [Saprospiraceae bacterium]|nr:hypothetical protein [Saprospiraceae bacterium]